MEIIANGGLYGNTPNTLDALLLTRNISYLDGILINVYKTLDNVLVLANNDELKKDTLSNKMISTSTYKELRKIKFPSHIFKYYIPTLKELLEKYQCNKKILLKLNNVNKDYLDLLYQVLKLYHYDYYYILDDSDIINKHELLTIGKVCHNYLYLDKINKEVDNNEDIFLIVKNSYKISYNNTHFDDIFN